MAEVKPDEKRRRQDGTRETVEQIVVAFILAFLFRTFEAEAFVIPTGSMAPTLYGRHIDVHCPQCGYDYAVGASGEVDNDGYFVGKVVETALCPNCRFETHVKNIPGTDIEYLPVFKGDRILVNKFPYEFGDPQRWDVVVFKYPESPTTNYIKRVVGLPGETLEIRQGDVYVNSAEQPEWRIARKDDPDKQRELQILVYDDRFPEKLLHELAWPERWAAVRPGDRADEGRIAGWLDDEEGWKRDAEARSFHLSSAAAAGDAPRWVRYRHFVPEPEDWVEALAARAAGRAASLDPMRRLQHVSDFTGYNAFTTRLLPGSEGPPDSGTHHGLHWVGDLTLSCRIEVGESESGQLIFELNEGDRWYRCTIDVATGEAALSYLDENSRTERPFASGKTKLRAGGTHDVSFANADDRLCLWIDRKLVQFDRAGQERDAAGGATDYPPMGGMGGLQAATDADKAPAGIAARGVEATVSRLLLERDIYYRADMLHPDDQHRPSRDDGPRQGPEHIPENDDSPHAVRFTLGQDEFFMLGDNSPQSQDSRLWGNTRYAEHRHAVPRSALVGKAFFIYWPHGRPFLNDGRGYPDDGNSVFDTAFLSNWFYHQERRIEVDRNGKEGVRVLKTDYPSFRVPFYPQFGRMERIR
ncbi:MAG: signal peptidase I [Planctomycetales bacterium]